jgi:hypothetical protein
LADKKLAPIYYFNKSQLEDQMNRAVECLLNQLEYDGVITGEQSKQIDGQYIINILERPNLRVRLQNLLFGRRHKGQPLATIVISKIGSQSYAADGSD